MSPYKSKIENYIFIWYNVPERCIHSEMVKWENAQNKNDSTDNKSCSSVTSKEYHTVLRSPIDLNSPSFPSCLWSPRGLVLDDTICSLRITWNTCLCISKILGCLTQLILYSHGSLLPLFRGWLRGFCPCCILTLFLNFLLKTNGWWHWPVNLAFWMTTKQSSLRWLQGWLMFRAIAWSP